MQPQLTGQRLGTSGRPSNIGDDSPEVQALEALDLGQVRQARIGDPLATPAWEHDPSNIGAGPACHVLLYAAPAARPALGIMGLTQQQRRRPHLRYTLWRPSILARCARPASVIWLHDLRGSTTQAASVPGLSARWCSMPPQLPGQRSGPSDRPSNRSDDSP